jgi:hypothetical protein
MAYRCEATSVAGFVQQLAVGYIANGYFFYVTGHIPDHKDPVVTDRKIIAQYHLDISRWSRARRKKLGVASVQYLRYGRFFVLIATHGNHPFFAGEEKQVHDIRRRPLYFMGYSIGCRRARAGGAYHASVLIQRALLVGLKVWFERIALLRTVEGLCRELRSIPYEPYAPVRDQLRGLLRAVNRRRKAAGLELVPREALWLRRIPVKPFGEEEDQTSGGKRRKCVANPPWPATVFGDGF